MATVLIGAGGTGTSFAIVSRLRANWGDRIRIVVTDIFAPHLVTTSLLADAFYQVPKASETGYENVVREIIAKEQVTTFVPILNDELIVAARIAKAGAFPEVDFWSSDLHAACVDKIFADGWLRKIGIRTPRIVDVRAGLDGEGPWFAKPRSGFGSRGTGIVTRDEINGLSESDLDNLVIQEVCEQPEITIDSFYDAETGRCRAFCRERLETKSGVCTKARIFHDDALHEFAQRIGRALHQRGTICFQAMRRDGEWALTDLNLRSGAGTALTCAAGFDVLSAAFACRRGEDYTKYLPEFDRREEFYVTRQYSEFVMSVSR